jgi:chromosome segregation ATPase
MATKLRVKDEAIKSLQLHITKLAAELAASKEQREAYRQKADAVIVSLRSRNATAQAKAAKANKRLEAHKTARAQAQALEAHTEVVHNVEQDKTALARKVARLQPLSSTAEFLSKRALELQQDNSALESEITCLRLMVSDAASLNLTLNEQVLALRQDKITLESQVAHLRPLATKARRKVASLSREMKKLMKEKESFLREKLILQVGVSVCLFGCCWCYLMLFELVG